ncbi:hypothetical protein GCM10010172_04940 [Paractinoplanes ferrugineus]|uniref:Tetratricopeptide repeat protein n=1 Tax=Paractinoplanes ferrugineus TaxID=113564 RepID=A0A919MFC3_9ACTN|nr:tetratricopeptide repeat protein [Actinoplanes ferrugineus]GIE12589.1 hypothetical protein Afe05nite_44290 [Actinoplanes ferrugineus]
MSTDDRIERARKIYERVVYSGDAGALGDAARGLDAVEADVALARGRLLHAAFQSAPADSPPAGVTPVEDPAELPLFERALELYQAAGDARGEAEAEFWIGCVHQFIRRDHRTATPHLQRSSRLAERTGDKRTRAEALRHLGIEAHAAGRLDEAREQLTESSRLRREIGALPGVASNLVGLAYIAAAQDRRADALATLDEAEALADAHDAHAVKRHIQQARATI